MTFYKVYNKFYIKYENDIKEYLVNKYKEGLTILIDCYPYKVRFSEENDVKASIEVSVKNKNTLRSQNNIFYTTRYVYGDIKSKDWLNEEDLFTESMNIISNKYDNPVLESNYSDSKLKKSIKELSTMFKYYEKLNDKKGNKFDSIRKYMLYNSKFKNRPFPDIYKVYHRKSKDGNSIKDVGLGIIDI